MSGDSPTVGTRREGLLGGHFAPVLPVFNKTAKTDHFTTPGRPKYATGPGGCGGLPASEGPLGPEYPIRLARAAIAARSQAGLSHTRREGIQATVRSGNQSQADQREARDWPTASLWSALGQSL